MIIPFFLTRQTANLMEDFAREVQDGPALFLLYGENGVGKTRLLQELCQSRFSERRVHWLDLGSGDSADGTRLDYSHGIEDLFHKADEGDIIIADHFEEALKKTRHQLFLSWSTDGIDKNLHLIIGSSNEGFNELRQLSQHYQVRVQSFQQMPFSSDEVESFLRFCLFPDQAVSRLRIPGPVRKQLAATQGNVGQLIDVIEHNGKQIKSSPDSDSQSIRQGSKIIVAVLLLFVVAVGVGWFFIQSPFVAESESLAATPSQTPAPAASEESIGSGAEAADAAVVTAAADSAPAGDAIVNEAASEAPSTGVTETPAEVVVSDEAAAPAGVGVGEAEVPEDEPREMSPGGESAMQATASEIASTEDESADELSDAESAPEAAGEQDAGNVPAPAVIASNTPELTADETLTQAEGGVEPGTVPDSEAVIDESFIAGVADAGVDSSVDAGAEEVARLDLAESGAAQPRSNWDRFARELENSKDWIGRHEDAVGTIQILLLTFDTFDADVYYQYVANLARKNVDTDQLHVFKTLTGNKEVYSVFYGEYASRPEALRAIGELPEVLRNTSPIPRSVGGIWQEIRRLENQN